MRVDIGGTPYPPLEQDLVLVGETSNDGNGLSQATSGYESVSAGTVHLCIVVIQRHKSIIDV